MDATFIHSRKKKRMAVLTLELVQGICFASWASRLPDIKDSFGVDNLAIFGVLLFLIPIGKFIAIPSVGYLFNRIGNRKTVLASIIGYALSLLLIGVISHNIYLLGGVLLLFGLFWNMTDISLNTQAIEVDRLYDKSIIATFHAGWSFAACVGALIGFIMINTQIVYHYHLISVSILAVIVILLTYKYLPLDSDGQHAKEEVTTDAAKQKTFSIKGFRLPELLLLQLGIIWLIALVVENTMFEWSDIYFQSVIKAPASLQVGFLVFMSMMFVGRLLTNMVYRFWTKRTVLIVAGSLIFAGFTISSLFVGMSETLTDMVIINSAGFMLIGLGISCVVPTLYSIVGDKATTPVGMALTIMSGISFIGPLAAPLLVGTIAENVSLKAAYLVVGLFGLCIVVIAMFSKTLRK